MVYTVNKNKYQILDFFIGCILLCFFIFSMVINKKFLEMINKYILKDNGYYILKKPLQYYPWKYKNIILYDKNIIALDLKENYNNKRKILLSNGIVGWINEGRWKINYNYYIGMYENNSYILVNVLNINIKNDDITIWIINPTKRPYKIQKFFLKKQDFYKYFF